MAERELISAVHHPHSLRHVMFLECSCGYAGLVTVDEKTVSGQPVEEKVSCPNCGSATVHIEHVTEVPTTIHNYSDGESETITAKQKEQVISKPVNVAPTAEEVVAMVMKHPIFDRLNTFLAANETKKESEKKDGEV
jgi:hypothetical protein